MSVFREVNGGIQFIGNLPDQVISDGVTSFRFQVRTGLLMVDKTLTEIGFAGAESLDEGITGDWINVSQFG